MEPLKPGDKLSPVTATHVVGVKEIAGVVFRLESITRLDQPLTEALLSPSFVMKAEQARALAKNLLDAANGIEAAAAAAPPKEDSLADLLAGQDFQIKN